MCEFFISAVSQVIDWFNPKSDNFIFIKIVRMFEEVFIPNEEQMNTLLENIKAKFAFIDGAKASITSLSDILEGIKPAPSLSINIGATKYTEARTVKIIDLSWYTEFKGIGDAILTGFIYVGFLWRYFGNLPSLFSGAGSVVTTVTKKGGNP